MTKSGGAVDKTNKSKAATATAPRGTASSSKATNSNNSKDAVASSSSGSNFISNAIYIGIMLNLIYYICKTAYNIRMQAINEFGPVIHEFDPYFNYRATEYLYWNGRERFFRWFDKMVWYPLGRPVGTTIYPGMQFTAVFIKNHVMADWSLNDVCCYIPSWFGVLTTIMTGLISYECTRPRNTEMTFWNILVDLYKGKRPTTTTATGQQQSKYKTTPALECGVATMFLMAIVPAHLMRSVGGGYDNESIAVFAMCLTFWFWIQSLANNTSLLSTCLFAIGTGLAYFYMVAAWGGYVFVLNLIGVHAAVLVLLGRFSIHNVYWSYTLFYIVGTALAIQIPVVGWTPLKSLEQLGPAAVFVGYQVLHFTERRIQSKAASSSPLTRWEAWKFRIQVFGVVAALALAFCVFVLAPTGYFGPISSRVRGLFVKHTKTGNPLVDSVAEHQPANNRAYFQYLHYVCSLAPIGFLMVFTGLSNASSFLLVWGWAAYFFSHKMVRLILLTAPIASILGGIAAGRILSWSMKQWWDVFSDDNDNQQQQQDGQKPADSAAKDTTTTNGKGGGSGGAKDKKGKRGKGKAAHQHQPQTSSSSPSSSHSSFDDLVTMRQRVQTFSSSPEGIVTKRAVSLGMIVAALSFGSAFWNYCWKLSHDLSNPTIMLKGRLRDGNVVVLDDYREAYFWLHDNTPEDSRVMAWWDYGYQISAIANRTTIADGNTWNHEHIALLGKALTTDLKGGWEIARHLADYVLVWGGGGGDDLAKSPHLARIANSVYRDHCPDDPTCRAFGFVDRQGTPSAMMRRSFLYNLHGGGIKPDVTVPEDMFVNVYNSKYGKVRIYKIIGVSEESKQWVAENYKCDAPGSWFCPGTYPPGLQHILDSKKDFAQLEDFNRGSRDDEYQQQYFKDLKDPNSARKKVMEKEREEMQKRLETEMSDADIEAQQKKKDVIYKTWENSEAATRMWHLIKDNDITGLKVWLEVEPHMAFIRSEDGRGPMFWAFEERNEEITKILLKAGVPHTDADAKGLTPLDLLEGKK